MMSVRRLLCGTDEILTHKYPQQTSRRKAKYEWSLSAIAADHSRESQTGCSTSQGLLWSSTALVEGLQAAFANLDGTPGE